MTTLVRSVLAAFALCSAAVASAGPMSGYEVCESLLGSAKKIECLAAIGGQETDRNAAGVCGQMLGDHNKVSCIKAIAGKVYDPMAVRVCQNLLGDAARVRCLDEAGRWPRDREPVCLNKSELLRALREIKSLLNDWRVRDAVRAVESLEDRVDDCRD